MPEPVPTAALASPDGNIARHLVAMARARPYAPAIYFADGKDRRGRTRYVHLTYRELDEASDRIARGLLAVGVPRGARVALMVRPSLELFSLAFGLFKAGAVPVMIDPGIGVAQMGRCLASAAPEVFVGVPEAHLARLALGWARKSVRVAITVGSGIGPRAWGGHTLDAIEREGDRDRSSLPATRADELAAILFTSGSTGPPKGAVYSHATFGAQVDSIRKMYDIRPGEIDLPTFPLFALFDPALGMTTVLPEMDPARPAKANPKKILDAIDAFGVTNMFGSPALLDALSRWASGMGVRIGPLRRVISAGAPVSATILARMRSVLAGDADVVTPYGATECLPVASIESREVLGETAALSARGAGTCVGRPVPEAEVRIVAITDEPIGSMEVASVLAQGQIGEIVVRGPMATRSYHDAPAQTALAKIADGNSFWHRMGDLGYLDAQGRLWMCGRKSERVRMRGRTLFTVPCEGIFDAHPSVRRSALVGLPREDGDEPVLTVELEAGASDGPELQSELRTLAGSHEQTRPIARFLVHPGFPVDVRHNAKIKRELLRAWAQKQ